MQVTHLAARLFELRWPGREPREEDLRPYEQIPASELRGMVQALESASEAAASRRKVTTEAAEARAALRTRQDTAIAGLDALANRIAARRQEASAPAEAVPVPLAASGEAVEEHLEAVLKLLAHGRRERSIFEALQVRFALDEVTSPWRRNGADELFDLILKGDGGNLINVLQVKTGHGAADDLKVASVERYLEFALQKTSWGVVRLLDRKLLAHAGRDKGVRRLLSDHALRSSVFEPSFLTDPLPVLTAAAATESLAKLFLFGSEFAPTRVVSVGAGGQMVGEFVRSELRLGAGRSLHWNARARTLRQLTQDLSAEDRILVVSDVASPMRDLSRLREAFGARLPDTSMAFTALAGQANTYEALRPGSVVFFANLTAQADATLPWMQAGSYHRTRASHFFGHSTPSPLRIAKDFFASVTNGLRAMVR